MSSSERLRSAADAIAKDIEAGASAKERNAALQVQASMRHVPDVEAAGTNGFKVISRKLLQADALIKGVGRDAYRQILDTIDFATKSNGNPIRWICQLENPENTLAFVREVFGKDTGNVEAKAAAKAWIAGVEELRTRFNAAGGQVRKLLYGYLPQPHDAGKVRDAGINDWVRKVRGWIDRDKYYDELGRKMDEQAITEMLEQSWRTISSDGLNNLIPGESGGSGALAGRHAETRELHFATPEGYTQYLSEFGSGTAFTALQAHVGRWARDIALVETFGPNPEHTFQTMHDTARKGGGRDRVGAIMTTTQEWKTLTNEYANPESQSLARFAQGLRNIEVAGKLQQTPISSITDIATYYRTLGFNHLSYWRGTVSLVRAFGKQEREFADLAGLIADSHISDMNRWAEDNIGHGWSAKLSNGTMKASGLNALTDATRRAFSVTMMGGMARLAKTPWDKLNKYDRARLKEQGWSPEEYAVLGHATPETWRKTPMLTPESIAAIEGIDHVTKQRVISRLLGTIVDESEFASINPDLVAKTIAGGGLRRGTGQGELWKCAALFKGFGLSMITRHWDRMLNSEALSPAGRVMYGATMFPKLTLLGAASILLGDIANGRDPRDITGAQGTEPARAAKFWLAAFLKGGGAGFVGDMLLSGVGRQGQSGASAAVSSVAGPVIGSGFELLYDVGAQNLQNAATGEEGHGKEAAIRWVRGHTPGINMWYSKAVLDHAFLNDLQEQISPGFNERVQQRAKKQWNQDFWFSPDGDVRAPNLGAAIGQQ